MYLLTCVYVEPTVTSERLLKVLKDVKPEDWNKLRKGLHVSHFKIRETEDTADEQKEALLRIYADQPHSTWWEVCSALRMSGYQELADSIRSKYIGEGDCISCNDLYCIKMIAVTLL